MIKLVNNFESVSTDVHYDDLLSAMYTILLIGKESNNPQWAESNNSYYKISHIIYERNFSADDVMTLCAMIYKYSKGRLTLTTQWSGPSGYITLGKTGDCHLISSSSKILEYIPFIPDLYGDISYKGWNFSSTCDRMLVEIRNLKLLGVESLREPHFTASESAVKEYISKIRKDF